MDDQIVSGQIENTETGEVTTHSHYLFSGGFEINTFVRKEKVQEFTHPDDTMQISIDCLGLDSCGFVFPIGLHFDFEPDQADEKNKVLADITEGSILSIKGTYGIIPEESLITVFTPNYSQLPPDFSVDELQEVFRHNWDQKEKKGK